MTSLKFDTKLSLPKLLDLTNKKGEFGYVTVNLNTDFKPAPDCAPSGDNLALPVFSSCYHLGSEKKDTYKSFGLPFFKFKKGSPANIHFTNNTGYSFNLHWHGLNTPGDIDGATETLEFGVDTLFSPEFDLTIPAITNNSGLLWVHAHNMFISAPIMYGGAYGSVLIVDDESKSVTDKFEYGDNHLILGYQDIQYNSDGSLSIADIYTDENRNCFGMINGTTCINWYQDGGAPYTTQLYHKSSKNLVKIDFFSPTNSFRYYYVGVCDKHDKIKSFYIVQADDAFRNPLKQTMVGVAPAQRFSILVDLKDFKDGEAYVFMYNFDLTENYNFIGINPETGILQAPIPDFTATSNPTPYPTPIPDPTTCGGVTYTNQQGDATLLTYPPICPPIPQVVVDLPTGNIPAPQQTGQPFTIKKFLKLKWKKKHDKDEMSLEKMVKKIRKVVFGKKNYHKYENIIKQPNFEFNNQDVNYISLLNPKYFYNIPDVANTVGYRNFLLNGDNCQNYMPNVGDTGATAADCDAANPLGGTEFVDGQNRVFFDLWNSAELDLEYALFQYNQNPNNWKPDVLPTTLFKISQTDMEYYNTMMESNDTLMVQIYNGAVTYDELNSLTPPTPVGNATIVFPPTNPISPAPITKPYNIEDWTNLVNSTFASTPVNGISGKFVSDFLTYDWTFFPFTMNLLTNKSLILKSVMVKTTNKTSTDDDYYVVFNAPWSLLQFFGKSIGAMPIAPSAPCNNDMFPANKNFYVQSMYVNYATNDASNPVPTCGCDGNALMIIPPDTTFQGFYDGYENDNLMNFSVKGDSTEYWVYHNLDTEDSHPLHFHLTSGYVDPKDPINSTSLVDDTTLYYPHTYSLDMMGVPPQQQLAWYLKFSTYTSQDTGLNNQPQRQPYLGFMYHCHFMEHHDMNMMGQYFVYADRDDYFNTTS
jgi:FtsP/CotA-like multicopper oxidase with cupredoxin domain